MCGIHQQGNLRTATPKSGTRPIVGLVYHCLPQSTRQLPLFGNLFNTWTPKPSYQEKRPVQTHLCGGWSIKNVPYVFFFQISKRGMSAFSCFFLEGQLRCYLLYTTSRFKRYGCGSKPLGCPTEINGLPGFLIPKRLLHVWWKSIIRPLETQQNPHPKPNPNPRKPWNTQRKTLKTPTKTKKTHQTPKVLTLDGPSILHTIWGDRASKYLARRRKESEAESLGIPRVMPSGKTESATRPVPRKKFLLQTNAVPW